MEMHRFDQFIQVDINTCMNINHDLIIILQQKQKKRKEFFILLSLNNTLVLS